MNPLHQTLFDLVSIPSVTGNEGRICTAVAERMLPLWTMRAVNRVGNALVVGQQTGRPLITLFGHLDTVPEQGNAAGHGGIRPGKASGTRLSGPGPSLAVYGVGAASGAMTPSILAVMPIDVICSK